MAEKTRSLKNGRKIQNQIQDSKINRENLLKKNARYQNSKISETKFKMSEATFKMAETKFKMAYGNSKMAKIKSKMAKARSNIADRNHVYNNNNKKKQTKSKIYLNGNNVIRNPR